MPSTVISGKFDFARRVYGAKEELNKLDYALGEIANDLAEIDGYRDQLSDVHRELKFFLEDLESAATKQKNNPS